MKKTWLGVCCLSLMALSGCRSAQQEPYYHEGQWHWPAGFDESQKHLYFLDANGHVVKRKPRGSVAPFPFPKEPEAHEPKVYGVPQSEWDSFSSHQQALIKQDFQAKHAQQENAVVDTE